MKKALTYSVHGLKIFQAFYGEGNTVQETKDNILAAVELYKKYNDEIPAELQGDMDIEWVLMYNLSCSIIAASLPKLLWKELQVLIKKQLGHYASGLKNHGEHKWKRLKTHYGDLLKI